MRVHECFNAMDLKKQPAAINISNRKKDIVRATAAYTAVLVYAAVARTISFFLFNLWRCQVVGPLYNDSVLIVYLYCKCSHFKGPRKINSNQNTID
jgi:hypothetical protein